MATGFLVGLASGQQELYRKSQQLNTSTMPPQMLNQPLNLNNTIYNPLINDDFYKTLSFSGRFTVNYEHYANPFKNARKLLEDDAAYLSQKEQYLHMINNSTKKKLVQTLLNGGVGAAGAFAGYLASGNFWATILGGSGSAVAGTFTGELAQKILAGMIQAPPLVKLYAELKAYEEEMDNGWYTTTLKEMKDWRHVPRHWFFDNAHKSTMEAPAIMIMTALISRYKTHQDALDDVLPSIQGWKHQAPRILEPLKQASRMLQQNPPKESPAVYNAIQNMIDLAIVENKLLGANIDTRAEVRRWQDHLRSVLPDLIDYLK